MSSFPGTLGNFREASNPFRGNPGNLSGHPFWESFRGAFMGRPAALYGEASSPFRIASGWGLGAIFTVNSNKIFAQKLRIIILLHFWTSDFSIALWENPKAHHFHDFQIFGRVHDSQNQLILLLDTKILQRFQ